jgi:hypothetical protein
MSHSRIFKVKDGVDIVCDWVNTRYGFRHDARLFVNGREYGTKSKACYYNRTWERFEFETVVLNLIQNTDYLTSEEKSEFLKGFNQ